MGKEKLQSYNTCSAAVGWKEMRWLLESKRVKRICCCSRWEEMIRE